MNIDMLNKTMELEKECERFLTAFNPDSLPRVVERGMKPVLLGAAELIKGSMLGFIDVLQVGVGKDKIIEGIVHIGVGQDGGLISIITRMDGSLVTPPRAIGFEELVGLGITGVQIIEGLKKFASGVIQHQMTHTEGQA
jgi:hypothetical protein